MSFIADLENIFQENYHPENAIAMSKYMRNQFSFFGIKTKKRRLLLKQIYKANQEEVSKNFRKIALELFEKQERDFHYCAIEISIQQLQKKYQKQDIQLIEKLLTKNSWWDSVDTIAKNMLGEYLVEFPEEIPKVIDRFSHSENMWFNRTAILFQLAYKEKTDFNLLKLVCEKHKDSSEFFIQKAIGWALREYAKTNLEAVKNYVSSTDLKPLSKKEALKNHI
jgi:3-methyladenine DNA glycosylase AlkD